MKEELNLDAEKIRELDSSIRTQFRIHGIQIKDLLRFKEVARECNNSYAMALIKLLDYYEADMRYQSFNLVLAGLIERVESLESASIESTEVKPKAIKTFGSRNI